MGRNSEEYYPEKVVVITGPSLGSSLKLVLFGALLGAAGTLFLLRREEENEIPGADGREKTKQLLQRTSDLARRTKNLAQEIAQGVIPHWQDVVETAKSTAAETEQELHKEIEDEQ